MNPALPTLANAEVPNYPRDLPCGTYALWTGAPLLRLINDLELYFLRLPGCRRGDRKWVAYSLPRVVPSNLRVRILPLDPFGTRPLT